MDNQLLLKVENFRAIKNAEIALDGITVVSGVNGCGKSTLSKLLYYTFKAANSYEELINDKLENELMPVVRAIDNISFELRRLQLNEQETKTIPSLTKVIKRYDILGSIEKIISHIDLIYEKLQSISEKIETNRLNRIVSILSQTLNVQHDNVFELINILKDRINDIHNHTVLEIDFRPLHILNEYILESFNENVPVNNYSILEYGVSINNSSGSLLIPHSINKALYIDSPMMFDDISEQHWRDMFFLITGENNSPKTIIGNILTSEILSGEVEYNPDDDSNSGFIYKRKDGLIIDLMNCATGVKSFAILQLLYKNGSLDKNTLLIIDEPEAHLHPQWIVEYARIIVLLNKIIGVKFFICSHNPDMISALKYISEKEGVEKTLNFYIAEDLDKTFSYSYRSLGNEIDDIFKSFNIAIDRINLYGLT